MACEWNALTGESEVHIKLSGVWETLKLKQHMSRASVADALEAFARELRG